VRYKLWRSNKDKEQHLLRTEGGRHSMPCPWRLGTWVLGRLEESRGGTSTACASLTVGRSGFRDLPCARASSPSRTRLAPTACTLRTSKRPDSKGLRPSGPTCWPASQDVLPLRWARLDQGNDHQKCAAHRIRRRNASSLEAWGAGVEQMSSPRHHVRRAGPLQGRLATWIPRIPPTVSRGRRSRSNAC
jgi:hypothetical protein